MQPEAALTTLNSAISGLRGAETGSFHHGGSLRPERLGTGALAFYKPGAAPAIGKKGGTVRRITGRQPAGGTAGHSCRTGI
ncbi:MAG: hypothetical protein ACLU38_11810 [Dysosmobacter sp.]